MEIKVINKLEDLFLIKKDWDKLFEQGDYSLFQSFDFNYYAWKHELMCNNSNQLIVTLIIKNKDVVAIFPFYIDSITKLMCKV